MFHDMVTSPEVILDQILVASSCCKVNLPDHEPTSWRLQHHFYISEVPSLPTGGYPACMSLSLRLRSCPAPLTVSESAPALRRAERDLLRCTAQEAVRAMLVRGRGSS